MPEAPQRDAGPQRRVGRREITLAIRSAVLTISVTLLTGVTASVGFLDPPLQAALRRDAAALAAGQWWRLVSPLLVRTDGWEPLVVTLVGTILAGWVVERRLGTWRWLGLYLGAGLAGQLAGYLWDPTGAGSSVAMLGLFAGVWYDQYSRPGQVDTPARLVGLIGLALAAALVGAALAPTATLLPAVLASVVGGLGVNLLQRLPRPAAARGVSGGALLLGVALTVLRDNHGPAILVGFGAAALLGGRPGGREPDV